MLAKQMAFANVFKRKRLYIETQTPHMSNVNIGFS